MIRCLDYIAKHELVDSKELASLVKAEWQTIRTNQSTLLKYPGKPLFSEKCCGILFFGDHAIASNGHWLIHVVTDGPSYDYNVSHFFYDYLSDEVIENYIPFSGEGVYIADLIDLIYKPQQYQFKLRPVDITDFAEQMIPTIRNRRNTLLQVDAKAGSSNLDVTLSTRNETISEIIRLPVPMYSPFPQFSVNLSYFCKIMAIADNYSDIVIVETDGFNAPIYVKLPGLNPGLTMVLGQYRN